MGSSMKVPELTDQSVNRLSSKSRLPAGVNETRFVFGRC